MQGPVAERQGGGQHTCDGDPKGRDGQNRHQVRALAGLRGPQPPKDRHQHGPLQQRQPNKTAQDQVQSHRPPGSRIQRLRKRMVSGDQGFEHRTLGKRGSPRHPSIFNAEMNASCGISTLPNWRIFFLPAFCLSSSLRLRDASPP